MTRVRVVSLRSFEVSESLEQTIAIVRRWLEEYEHEKAMGWR